MSLSDWLDTCALASNAPQNKDSKAYKLLVKHDTARRIEETQSGVAATSPCESCTQAGRICRVDLTGQGSCAYCAFAELTCAPNDSDSRMGDMLQVNSSCSGCLHTRQVNNDLQLVIEEQEIAIVNISIDVKNNYRRTDDLAHDSAATTARSNEQGRLISRLSATTQQLNESVQLLVKQFYSIFGRSVERGTTAFDLAPLAESQMSRRWSSREERLFPGMNERTSVEAGDQSDQDGNTTDADGGG